MFDASLAFRAHVQPRALAVVTPRRRVSYAEFDADVNRYALGLAELGIGPASGSVAVEELTGYRRVVLLMALARLGVATTVPADLRADLRLTEKAGAAQAGIVRLERDWIARIEAAAPVAVPSAPRDPDGLARVLLSSGSTGEPKRVPLSWRRMEVGGLNALTAYASGKLGVWTIATGIDSSFGFSMSTLAWSLGAAVAVDHGAGDTADLMERHASGLLGLTPIMLSHLLRRLPPGFEPKPDWRVVVTGGLLPPAFAREARRRLTPDLHVNYASTEAGRTAVGPAHLVESQPGAVGYVVPGVTLEIVDGEGRPVADGETGKLRIRSDRNAGRYLDDDEASARTFRDGWFYPGDLGRRQADGLIVIEGRVNEHLRLGETKMSPHVFENALLEHDQVRDAAAFTVPGPDGFEQCWVAIVVEGEVTREALMDRLRVAGVPTVPLRFAWAEEIPRNAMGKVDRTALRALTEAALTKK
jgi:acyl-CoA synthetase (AMP-forming)/AMP-acid ligase II